MTQPIAPHPALASTINARPPKGFMYYFAYGMDMNPDRFELFCDYGGAKKINLHPRSINY